MEEHALLKVALSNPALRKSPTLDQRLTVLELKLDAATGLGIFTLYSGVSDRAEPCESLKANTVFATGLEELVGHLEEGDHHAALGCPGGVAGPGRAGHVLAGVNGETFFRAFLVLEAAFEHVGLLDLDVLVIGQRRARRHAQECGQQAGVAVDEPLDDAIDGRVADAFVVESSSRVFEKAALGAAYRFRYKPRVIDGTAVATRGIQNLFRFEMP